MKSLLKTTFPLILLLALSFPVLSQKAEAEATGLPGDNFDLQGALQMFQKAGSPEEFEKLINTESNHVNNLDLNEDGEIDYVRVIERIENDIHVFILQVSISDKESQDIAVIELEKTGKESAMIQIAGDEDIYGEQIIVEPDGEGDNALINGWNAENLSGPSASFGMQRGVIVNVWLWPSVRFVYAVNYRPWISPWRWRHYPAWWRPWRPFAWHIWHPRRVVYHRAFIITPTHRVARAHRIYTPFRTTSVTVRTRHSVALNNYRVTRSKTTVTGPRGRSATKTTTTVSGRNGKTKTTRTKVRRH